MMNGEPAGAEERNRIQKQGAPHAVRERAVVVVQNVVPPRAWWQSTAGKRAYRYGVQ